MAALYDKFAAQIPKLREERTKIVKEFGDKQISDVNVAQAFGGMRGVKGMICDTSLVEPDKGLIIRGTPILELTDKIPEEIFYLLLLGELPNKADLEDLQNEYKKRAGTPDYVWKVLEAMPKESHPMAMLNTAILVMEHESQFRKRYAEGMAKTDYWEPALEDSLTLLANLPEIAAGIYRMRYNKGDRIAYDPKLDWGANYAHMLGNDDEDFYKALIRTTRCPPASTDWPARCTVWPTRSAWAGFSALSTSSTAFPPTTSSNSTPGIRSTAVRSFRVTAMPFSAAPIRGLSASLSSAESTAPTTMCSRPSTKCTTSYLTSLKSTARPRTPGRTSMQVPERSCTTSA